MDLLKLLRLQWDRAIAVGATALGLLALLLGYIGTSGTPFVAKQLPYFISGGLFGIFCLTVAAIAWISGDLRDEWRELHSIRILLEDGQRSGTGIDDLAQDDRDGLDDSPQQPEPVGRPSGAIRSVERPETAAAPDGVAARKPTRRPRAARVNAEAAADL